MIYITNQDLTVDSYQRFIDESTGDITGTVDKAEIRAIGVVTTYLSGRYKTDVIFGEPGIRNEVLVDIICKIVLKTIFGRNAARKVPSDVKEDYDAAIKQLEKINSGQTVLANLPQVTDDEGNPVSDTIFGNLSNPNFYI